MENSTEKLIKCFERLQIRIHFLKSGQIDIDSAIKNPYAYNLSIDDIVNSIYSVSDLETAQDYLDYYISQVDDFITNISKLLSNYKFKDDLRGVFTSDFPILKKTEVKQQFKKTLLRELTYYKDNLIQIRDQVISRFDYIKTYKLTNDKVIINLNGKEIGCLFNLFYETKLINNKKADGSDFTKLDLARFICNYFSSESKNELGVSSMQNNLSSTDPITEENVSNLLTKLLNQVGTSRKLSKKANTNQ